MRRSLPIFLFFAAIGSAQPNRLGYVPGQIIAQERRGADPAALSRAVDKAGAKLLKRLNQTHHQVLRVPEPQAEAIMEQLRQSGLFTTVERDGLARSSSIPNDPSFASEWHLSAIQAPAAWDRTTGSSSQIVAIVDSGVDATHPDLANRVLPGYNFVNGNTNTSDVLGHGTAVAGTVAATGNDGFGVAGLLWNTPILPVLVLDSTDYASYSNIASGINYAADRGARIINVSIGGSMPSSVLQSAVDYAWNKGSVVFAAAMNNSSSTAYYPAACNHVVAVSATDVGGSFASFSNYGNIDLSAPGNNILTTMRGGGFGYWAGTSFSSPLAAGVASLALSVQPSLSASALVTLLENNADDLGASGYDQFFGWGQVNAARTVAAAGGNVVAPPAVTIASPAPNSTVSGNVTVSGSASGSSISSVELYCDDQLVSTAASSNFALPWSTAGVSAGGHVLKVKAIDALGNVGSSSETVNVPAPVASPAPVAGDTTPPLVTISSPTGGIVSRNSVSIQGTAQDNVGIAQYSILIDNVQVSQGAATSFSYNWNTKKATTGMHVITVKAWDAAGNIGSASVLMTK